MHLHIQNIKKKSPDTRSKYLMTNRKHVINLRKCTAIHTTCNLFWLPESDFYNMGFIFNVLFKELILHSGCIQCRQHKYTHCIINSLFYGGLGVRQHVLT